jgi:hypothetical protein
MSKSPRPDRRVFTGKTVGSHPGKIFDIGSAAVTLLFPSQAGKCFHVFAQAHGFLVVTIWPSAVDYD